MVEDSENEERDVVEVVAAEVGEKEQDAETKEAEQAAEESQDIEKEQEMHGMVSILYLL